MGECPPLEYILDNIDTLPKFQLGAGGFSNVFLFVVNEIPYAVKIIPIENENQIQEFKQEVLNWKTANLNPRLQTIVPEFCESALVEKEVLSKFKTPIDQALYLGTEWRQPEKAIAYGFLFTKATNYISYSNLPKRYEVITQLVDNLIKALDILHEEGYIHGDIKLDNILIKNEPGVGVYFIDLAGLCKLPCERGIPWTPEYMPPDYAAFTKIRLRFQKPGTRNKSGRLRTQVTPYTFTRYSKEMDRYAMGKVILYMLQDLVNQDPRWGSDSSEEEKAMKEAYFQKAYTLLRYPIHIYAAEIGESKLPRSNRKERRKTRRQGRKNKD